MIKKQIDEEKTQNSQQNKQTCGIAKRRLGENGADHHNPTDVEVEALPRDQFEEDNKLPDFNYRKRWICQIEKKKKKYHLQIQKDIIIIMLE